MVEILWEIVVFLWLIINTIFYFILLLKTISRWLYLKLYFKCFNQFTHFG